MTNINEMLFKLVGFQYVTSFGLIIQYYHIQFSENVSSLCMIIITWGKYCFKRLSMGVYNSTDILQHKMNDLFHRIEFICVYIY